MTLFIVVASVLLVVVLAYAAATVLLARKIVYPDRAKPTRILRTTETSEIALSANALTNFEGIIGLLYDDETKLSVIKPGVQVDPHNDGVIRVLDSPADLRANANARACGNVFKPDEVTGTAPLSVSVQTATGAQPAWLFPGLQEASTTWVIHIHGMLAGRDSALRGVRAIAGLGWTSLVVSYPGDREALNEIPRPSSLGQAEWHAVDDAIGLALSRGARRIFLMGWSVGATIALHTTEKGSHRDAVTGMVLVSPVVDWARSISFSMKQRHIPLTMAMSAIAALSSPISKHLLGLDHPLIFPERLPTPTIPTLVIHSQGDRTTPFAVSVAFADQTDLVELEEFPSSPHAMEWNADPHRFSDVVQSWLIRRE